GGGGGLRETALSFTGFVSVITFCCCSTMSCVALCIKLASWMFGHRGRRQRVPLLPHEQQNDGEAEQQLYSPHQQPVIILDTNPAEQRSGCTLHASEIELRQVPFGNLEAQRETKNSDDNDDDVAFRTGAQADPNKIRKQQHLKGSASRMERDTTTGTSIMTRAGTPSTNGEQEDSSDFGEEADQEVDEEEEEEEERRRRRGRRRKIPSAAGRQQDRGE
ncbi:unnamed protein product, partial [Ectocarpus sp. 12 AP-2014]